MNIPNSQLENNINGYQQNQLILNNSGFGHLVINMNNNRKFLQLFICLLSLNQCYYPPIIQIYLHMIDCSPKKQRARRQEDPTRQIPKEEIPEMNYKDPRFKKADYYWSQAHTPSKIFCREQEKEEIMNFLKEGLRNKGSRQSLYISGVPGIGKTISVLEAIKELKQNNQFQKSTYKYIYINAMGLRKQMDFYKVLYHELLADQKRRVDSKSAMFFLDDLFRKGISQNDQHQLILNQTKILVIDEIDYLDTRDHDVLYNIFDWTQSPKSQLVIIAISNTISFPQNLSEKIASRIGDRRLIFQQYNAKDLEKIINQRIKEFEEDIIDQQAIEYITKKVTRFSSDVRKILIVLRQSIFIHLMQKQEKQSNRITLNNIMQAYQSVYENIYEKQIAEMPESYQNFLALLCSFFRKSYFSVSSTHLIALGQKQFQFEPSAVKELIICFRDLGIIAIKSRRTVFRERNKTMAPHTNEDLIQLVISVESLSSALFANDIQIPC